MSFKKLLFLLLLFINTNIFAQQKTLDCGNSHFCELPAPSDICGANYSAKLQWDSITDIYILSCNCDCTSQENHGWIAKKNNESLEIHETDASLIVRNTEVIDWNGLVPGTFGPIPLCSKNEADAYDLLALTKSPAEGEDPTPPYCYISEILKLNENTCSTIECQKVTELIKSTEARSSDFILMAYMTSLERLSKANSTLPEMNRKTFINYHIKNYGGLSKNQQKYNDIAFYWQRLGYDKDSIWLLQKVITNSPQRTVAYLNLADSLWNLSRNEESVENYKIYIDQMKAKKKEHLIPERALLRAHQQP